MNLQCVAPDAIEYVCDTRPLPMIESELQDKGATKADDPCIECGATTYELDNEIVCGTCSLVIDGSDETASTSKWEQFWSHRATYRNSKRIRCVGGFPHVHDWVTSDEIEGTVGEIEPERFYR